MTTGAKSVRRGFETSLAEARLQLLRRQLSPHFLFNTLNTISVLAQSGDQAAFIETLARLQRAGYG